MWIGSSANCRYDRAVWCILCSVPLDSLIRLLRIMIREMPRILWRTVYLWLYHRLKTLSIRIKMVPILKDLVLKESPVSLFEVKITAQKLRVYSTRTRWLQIALIGRMHWARRKSLIVTFDHCFSHSIEEETSTSPTLSIIPYYDVNGYRYQSLSDATNVYLIIVYEFIGGIAHLRWITWSGVNCEGCPHCVVLILSTHG